MTSFQIPVTARSKWRMLLSDITLVLDWVFSWCSFHWCSLGVPKIVMQRKTRFTSNEMFLPRMAFKWVKFYWLKSTLFLILWNFVSAISLFNGSGSRTQPKILSAQLALKETCSQHDHTHRAPLIQYIVYNTSVFLLPASTSIVNV